MIPFWLNRARRAAAASITPMTAITAVTTGAGQTVTLQQLTPTGGDCVVDWGDGGATSTITDGNTGTTTHVYAAAGTYHVSISNPHLLTVIDLRDSKIVFNSGNVGGIVPANLATLLLTGLAAGSVFNSADFSGAAPSVTLYLYFLAAGTYTFNSADFSGATPSAILYLYFSPAGTYTFNSADFSGAAPGVNLYLRFTQAGTYTFDSSHFAGSDPSSTLYLRFTQAGTYTFNSSHFAGGAPGEDLYLQFTQTGTYTFSSSHFAGAAPSSLLRTHFPQAGTYIFDSSHLSTAQPSSDLTFILHDSATTTIARADWTGIARKADNPTIQMGLSQTEVDAVLLGIYDDFANRTATNGTLNVAGSNAAPSGTLAAQCPPTAGKNAAYELVNDTCGVSTKHYAAVTIS